MNNDLYFVCKWNKIRKKTWSGTCFSLYKALQSHYTLIDVNLRIPFLIRLLKKLHIISRSEPLQIEINLFRLLHFRLFPQNKLKNKIFQFADFVPDKKWTNTFIYQDLCMTYVNHLEQQNPLAFQLSGFKVASRSERKRRSYAEQKYYTQCKGIFTMGHWLAQYLIENMGINPEKVHHVGGGININPALIKEENQREGNKILFIGRDFYRKGGDLVYDAFCYLHQRNPNIELHVAGPSKNPIRQPINKYYFWGDIPSEQLADLFNKCDIFCMPSHFEAYGLVFIEALTFGLPCIGRKEYEMPYFIEDGETGYLIEKDDPLLLAQKMENLLNDKRIQKNVYNRRTWYLKEYSWENVAARIAAVIK